MTVPGSGPSEESSDLSAVKVGQAEVEQDEVERVRRGLSQCRGAS